MDYFNTNTSKNPKVAIIREELVDLLGDHVEALILNQMLYWAKRTKDVDQYIREEAARNPDTPQTKLTHGWIYKSGKELLAELMLDVSVDTIKRRIKNVIKKGYLESRRNPAPDKQWDRTLQYRPNIPKIQADLAKLGYVLDNHTIPYNSLIIPIVHTAPSSVHTAPSSVHTAPSSVHTAPTIPETTRNSQVVVVVFVVVMEKSQNLNWDLELSNGLNDRRQTLYPF